ncbi:MAG: dihydrofolate reductase [Clostridiales Family XIII bacterium]|jgi:dihydrofolate reductase|nr:dihydrofolate reductase [Clostridiales Family XIII bacterium]
MNIIVAVDKNWGIGKKNKLLCYLPSDLKFFKEKTEGNIIIYGRKTLLSFPKEKPLKNRINIILTKNISNIENFKSILNENTFIANSITAAIDKSKKIANKENKEIYICGGEKTYKEFLPFVSRLYITKIDDDFNADKFLPNIDALNTFNLINESEIKNENGINFKFTIYERV